MLTADSKTPSQTPRPTGSAPYPKATSPSLKLRLHLSLSAVRLAAGARGRDGSRSGAPASARSAVRSPSACYRRCNGIRTVDACGGALKMPRTRSWVSGLLLLLPPPPAGSTTNVFLRVTCLRRPRTQIRPPPSPQTARASLAASPMYDPGVSSSKRVLASSGISSVCTKARMPAASTRRPRVSSLSFS
jgi:hypothetical protein